MLVIFHPCKLALFRALLSATCLLSILPVFLRKGGPGVAHLE